MIIDDYDRVTRDITTSAVVLDDIVSGADPKIWVMLEGQRFLLKRGKPGNELAIYSELIVSRIFEKLCLPCQCVELVRYGKLIWAMCSDVGSIKQFISVHDSSLDTNKQGKYYCMEDILYEISMMHKLTIKQRYDFIQFFKRMFVVDAWVANRDRHAGNWGYLESGEICPIFDNGAALFPSILRYSGETSVRNLLYKIVLQEPRSSVQFRNNKGKLKRNNFLFLLSNSGMVSEAVEWIKRFDINSIINYSLCGIPFEVQRFYYYQLYMRFNCVILLRDFSTVLAELNHSIYGYVDSVEELCGHLKT